MRYFSIIFLLAVALFSCNPGKRDPKTDEESARTLGTTRIEFEKTIYNFGTLSAGEIGICTFSFTNTGETGYRIESVETDCGCITTRFPKETIEPGAKGLIEVEFDSSGMYGREYKSIEINGNSTELKHLAIFAEVKNELFDINNKK